jgi:hypothetical protein
MPVNMAVPLLAAEAEDVHAFGGNLNTKGFSNAVNDRLKAQIRVQVEVFGDRLAVRRRRHQDMAEEGRVFADEYDRSVVLADHVMLETRGSCL